MLLWVGRIERSEKGRTSTCGIRAHDLSDPQHGTWSSLSHLKTQWPRQSVELSTMQPLLSFSSGLCCRWGVGDTPRCVRHQAVPSRPPFSTCHHLRHRVGEAVGQNLMCPKQSLHPPLLPFPRATGARGRGSYSCLPFWAWGDLTHRGK